MDKAHVIHACQIARLEERVAELLKHIQYVEYYNRELQRAVDEANDRADRYRETLENYESLQRRQTEAYLRRISQLGEK